MNNLLNFILIGRSGCGKGTQGELLAKYFGNLYYISSGKLFRDLATQKTDIGFRVKEILDKGNLQPDELAMALWIHELSYNVKPGQGIIFDGAPRRKEEAEHLDELLKFMGRFENTKIILIDISKKEALKRLKLRAREDDNDSAINNRMEFFDRDVQPVVDYYTSQRRLIKINGEQNVEKIFEDIIASL